MEEKKKNSYRIGANKGKGVKVFIDKTYLASLPLARDAQAARSSATVTPARET